MVYAPGHFEQATRPRRRYRSRRERLAVRAMALVTLVLIALVVFSLTNHQRTSGNGCVDFDYTTMIGGAETYECGAQARTLCASRAGGTSVDTDFQTSLHAACREAGLTSGSSPRGASAHS